MVYRVVVRKDSEYEVEASGAEEARGLAVCVAVGSGGRGSDRVVEFIEKRVEVLSVEEKRDAGVHARV